MCCLEGRGGWRPGTGKVKVGKWVWGTGCAALCCAAVQLVRRGRGGLGSLEGLVGWMENALHAEGKSAELEPRGMRAMAMVQWRGSAGNLRALSAHCVVGVS